MFKQIRSMLDQDDLFLAGTIEMDETLVGGKAANKHQKTAQWKPKTTVVGMAQRGKDCKHGKVIAKVVPDNKATTLIPQAKMKVLPASTVCTDELASYSDLHGLGYTQSR
jgi:transposase-like protein